MGLVQKVLFLIHDLGQGGAEKVLVNLVNNMDHSKFDITVMTLFDSGDNRQFLKPDIKYKTWCKKMIPGNSRLMKMLSPKQLHKLIIKEHYDVEAAYLEGPCARVISGCSDPSVKKFVWIHSKQDTQEKAAISFRSIQEAKECYGKFDKIVSVSKTVEEYFQHSLGVKNNYQVLYNTNESEKILLAAQEKIAGYEFQNGQFKLVGVGKLTENKGFDRLLKITKSLVSEGYPVHTYILGEGEEHNSLQKCIDQQELREHATLLGYQINPYKYVKNCDLFVCSSYSEGFSTAATEALIVGTPVCTVEVSGMREMLGANNEYGLVTENNDEALYEGIKMLLDNKEMLKYYKSQAQKRGQTFKTKTTVAAVEKMIVNVLGEKES